jgi:hypothetical protein
MTFDNPVLFRLMLVLLATGDCIQFGRAATPAAPAPVAVNPDRVWLDSLPAAPKPALKKHGLVAKEIRRWKPRGASQGVAVDANYFYGIGNFVVGKYDKKTGERVAEWAVSGSGSCSIAPI